jgi:hypothetical protein
MLWLFAVFRLWNFAFIGQFRRFPCRCPGRGAGCAEQNGRRRTAGRFLWWFNFIKASFIEQPLNEHPFSPAGNKC